MNKESQDEIKKLSEEIVTLHEDIVGIRALLDNVRSRLSTLEFTVANHVKHRPASKVYRAVSTPTIADELL